MYSRGKMDGAKNKKKKSKKRIREADKQEMKSGGFAG